MRYLKKRVFLWLKVAGGMKNAVVYGCFDFVFLFFA